MAEIIQKLFALFLVFSALLVLFSSRKKIGGKVGQRFFKYAKAYLFMLFVLLTSWLLSKSGDYNGFKYILFIAASIIFMIKVLLFARSKTLDIIVNFIAKLSAFQIRTLALMQLLLAWLLLFNLTG
ncbi:hypothetical protein [Candidatus Thioglobus sp.]|uniref:hypothetical protein n=1 Tax=Candidatus Thioglobus sp. TaxID=2026721 RepID=UPI003D13793F